MTDYVGRHKANKMVRTQPRVQPTGKHIGEYVHEDRTLERLGAGVFELRELLQEAFVGNPFRGAR